jgi:cytoskeleton protein RodZ
VNTHTQAALSAESVPTFLQQIEAQLLNSDTYHQVLNALQTKLGTVAEEFHSLLTALSREAIQYTLQQFVSEPAQAEPEAIAPTEPEPTPTSREATLLQLGQDIKQQRETQGISLQQLHAQTYVPLHHLKALEQGQIDRLPEDVFMRGFIRQIGNALAMDGVKLAARLPAPAPAKRAEPKRSPSLKPVAQISPVHLYVGYAALMAGAVGGLTWISAQPAQPEAARPRPKAIVGLVPAQQMAEAVVHPNVSPPETLHVR